MPSLHGSPSLLDGSPSLLSAGLTDPVAPATGRLLRRAVLDHITSESRRAFPPVVHVGLPAATVASLPLKDHHLDHALRADAIEAMARRVVVPRDAARADDAVSCLVWLTRRGALEVQDSDLGWASAACTAASELGRVLPMVVVTRQGWTDPRTGVTRTWQRLRPPRR